MGTATARQIDDRRGPGPQRRRPISDVAQQASRHHGSSPDAGREWIGRTTCSPSKSDHSSIASPCSLGPSMLRTSRRCAPASCELGDRCDESTRVAGGQIVGPRRSFIGHDSLPFARDRPALRPSSPCSSMTHGGQRRPAHTSHFIALAPARCNRLYQGSDYLGGKRRFEASSDDLRATALEPLDTDDLVGCEALFDGLGYFSAFELRDEVGDWCLRASALPGAGPRTFGMAAGMLGVYRGDFDFAVDYARRGIERADDPKSPATLECWQSLFGALQGLGRFDEMFEAARTSADVAVKARALPRVLPRRGRRHADARRSATRR